MYFYVNGRYFVSSHFPSLFDIGVSLVSCCVCECLYCTILVSFLPMFISIFFHFLLAILFFFCWILLSILFIYLTFFAVFIGFALNQNVARILAYTIRDTVCVLLDCWNRLECLCICVQITRKPLIECFISLYVLSQMDIANLFGPYSFYYVQFKIICLDSGHA